MISIKKIISGSLLGLCICAAGAVQAEPENNTETDEIKAPKAKEVADLQVGDSIYVSENVNVWLRTCPRPTCKIVNSIHVGEKITFNKLSDDRKFVEINYMSLVVKLRLICLRARLQSLRTLLKTTIQKLLQTTELQKQSLRSWRKKTPA